MIDIFDDQPVRMPEARLASDRRLLDRLKLFGPRVAQGLEHALKLVHLDGRPRHLERAALLWRSCDNQDRKALGTHRRQMQTSLRVGEAQRLPSLEQALIEHAGAVQRVIIDKYARVAFQDHRLFRLGGQRSGYITAAVVTAVLLMIPGSPASAQWAVFDGANFGQNVLQAARALQQIDNQITSLQQQAQMLVNQGRNLASLPLSTLGTLQSTVQQTEALLNEAQNIAYSVQSVEQQYQTQYNSISSSMSDAALFTQAQQRWQNAVGGFEDALKLQAGVVGNIPANNAAMTQLVGASQSSAGALQAVQAGNQLLALQSSQLSDIQAQLAANGRAYALQQAREAAAEAEGQAQYQHFAQHGAYVPQTITMFGVNGN